MIKSFLIDLAIKFASKLIGKLFEWIKFKGDIEAMKKELDQSLIEFREAMVKAKDGPMTKEQKDELNQAIVKFIRTGTNGGL